MTVNMDKYLFPETVHWIDRLEDKYFKLAAKIGFKKDYICYFTKKSGHLIGINIGSFQPIEPELSSKIKEHHTMYASLFLLGIEEGYNYYLKKFGLSNVESHLSTSTPTEAGIMMANRANLLKREHLIRLILTDNPDTTIKRFQEFIGSYHQEIERLRQISIPPDLFRKL